MNQDNKGIKTFGVDENTARENRVKRDKNKKISTVLLILALVFALIAVVLLLVDPIKNHIRKNKVETVVEDVKAEILKADVTEYTFVVSKDANKVSGEDYDVYGNGEDEEAMRAEIDAALAELPDDVTLNCIGIIEIPSIDCCDPILDNDSVIDLRYGIGHHQSSVLPGEDGNCCLLGHHMRVEGMFFNKLIEVKIGDTVKITLIDGSEYNYIVDKTIVVDPSELEDYVDGDDGTGKQITLVSCTYTNEGTKRILVIGHILEGED